MGNWVATSDRAGVVGVDAMNRYLGIKSRNKPPEPEPEPMILGTTEWVGIWLVVLLLGGLAGKLWAAFGDN